MIDEPKVLPTMIKLSMLKPAPWNPREISTVQFERLKLAVQQDPEFLWSRPIIAMADGTIYGGNMRFRVAQDLGWDAVPAIIEDIPIELAKERALRDNNQFGDWDEQQLAEMVYEMRLNGTPVETLGFSDREIAELIESVAGGEVKPTQQRNPGAEDVADLRDRWMTEPGQIWAIPTGSGAQLNHRLMVGDATNPEHVAKLFGPFSANLMNTDPPYLTDYDGGGHASSFGKESYKREDSWDTFVDIETGVEFYKAFIKNARQHLDHHAPIYQWHANRKQSIVEEAWLACGLLVHQSIVWVKNNPNLGHFHFMWAHESCLYGWHSGSQPPLDRRPPYSSTTVWEIENTDRLKSHPTQKPVELFARPMRYHTRRDEIVYEPFAGSGSQLVAAEQELRICFALEIDPGYAAVCLQRMAGLGLEPRLV